MPRPPKAGIRLGPPCSTARPPRRPALPLDVPLPLRTGSDWVAGPSWSVRLLPRSHPLPAGSQLSPAGLPPGGGAAWPGTPLPGAPFRAGAAARRAWIAGAPGEPAFAAGVKDGEAGAGGSARGRWARTWGSSRPPWPGKPPTVLGPAAVAVGADSDGGGAVVVGLELAQPAERRRDLGGRHRVRQPDQRGEAAGLRVPQPDPDAVPWRPGGRPRTGPSGGTRPRPRRAGCPGASWRATFPAPRCPRRCR